MLFNYILIAIIVVAVLFALYRYNKSLSSYKYEEENDEIEVELDIDFLVKETAKAFSRTLKKNINDDNLSKQAYLAKKKRTSALRQALTESGYGNPTAKRVVKNNIKDLINDNAYGIDEVSINNIIDFSNPRRISSQQKFEIILYMYNRQYGMNGFEKMVEEWGLDKPVEYKGEPRYIVTKETMNIIYLGVLNGTGDGYDECSLKNRKLSYDDKVEILTQAIYERYTGFGAVDMLWETTIDGIDAGVSGIPKGSFVLKTESPNISYSYDSIWITYHGINMHMQCLSFGSQSELIRVCDNIYKYDAQEALSRTKGYVQGTMMDGSRIIVARPPFADSYCFVLRKFNSTPSIDPFKLIHDENAEVPIIMMKWLIKGQRNIAITGSQNTGKTTWLKSSIRYIDPVYNLRVQESKAELNLNYAYPERNVISFQETPSVDAQEGLNIQKKTNGSVNIIGEVATAIQASHIIQTTMVASLFALFTHHAKTAADLVEAISNNLLELGLYNNKKDAVAMTSKVLNIDMHLANVNGRRFIERITEIEAIGDEKYPSERETPGVLTDDATIKADMPEYFKRMTNPKLYETKNLVEWQPLMENGEVVKDENGKDKGIYVLVKMPSSTMLKEIKEKLSSEEVKEFEYELDMIKRISEGEKNEEIDKWRRQAI